MGRFIDATLRLIDNFTSPMNNAVSSLERNARNIQAQGKQIEKAGKGIASMGSTLTKSVTVPIVGLGVAAVKTAADFEAGMSKVASISGDTGNATKELIALADEMELTYQKNADGSVSAMDILSAKAKEMGAKTKFSATEAADAFSYMAMAGWKTTDMMNGIEGIMYLAGATGEELAATSDIVTDALTAFGMTAADTNRFVDVLAKASSNSNTNVSLMGETFKYVAPSAGALGYSIEDTAVAIGLMANSGIKASQAGTSLNSLLTRMAKPTKESRTAMEALGISLTDSEGNMKSFATVMADMRKGFSGLTETQKAQYAAMLAGKTGMAGLLGIVNASQGDFDKLTQEIADYNGAAEAMYNIANDNLSGQLTKIKSTLESIAITFGNKLLPYIKEGAEKLQALADKFNSLNDAQVNTIIKVAAIAAAVGPAILVFGKMVLFVGKVVTAVGNLGAAIGSAGGVMALITSPAGIVIGVLAAIVAATVLVIKNFDKIKPVLMQAKSWFVETFGESIKNAVSGFKDALGKTATEVKAKLPSIIQAAKDALDLVMPAIKSIGSAVRKTIPVAVDIFKTLFKEWGQILQTAIGVLKKHFSTMFETIKKVANSVAPIIKSVVGTVAKVAPIIISAFAGAAKKLSPIMKVVANVIRVAVSVVGNLFSKALELVGNAVVKVMPFLKQVIDIIGNAVVFAIEKASPIVTKLAETFTIVFNAIGEKLADFMIKAQYLWSVVEPIVSKIGENAKFGFEVLLGGAIGAAIGWFENFIVAAKEVFSGVTTYLGGVLDFIQGVFTGNWSKAWEGIKTIFSGIFTSISAIAKSAMNSVISIINGAISGINKMGITIPDWVPGLGGKAFKIDVPKIPMLYTGTTNWKGGPAVIHDRGAEIVDLPSGTRVYPHDKSLEMARAEGTKATSISIAKLADTIVVREEADINKIANAIVQKIEKTACNMA